LQRYPDMQARVGAGLQIDDVVEEVFLTAFDKPGSRQPGQAIGAWLEGLIDPAVRALREKGDEELEVINLARTARAAEQGPQAV